MSSKEKKLVELCDLISRGITPSYTDDINGGITVINQKCIRDNKIDLGLARLTDPNKKKISDTKYIKKYDILVNSTGVGTLGRVAQIRNINTKMAVDSHVTIVRPKSEINPIFLGYNLFMNQRYIEYLGEGSTGQTELSRIRLGEAVKIKVPSLVEQDKIAKVLLDLDEKIEVNNQINKKLEEMAQAIFKRWFIDFEFPDENGNPYKSSGGEMIESEMGMIPKGWHVKKIEDVVDFYNGYAFKSKDLSDKYTNNSYYVFKMGNIIKGGGFNKLGTKSYIDKDKCGNLNKYLLKKGDILMCMTDMKSNIALLGNTALMDEDNKYIVNQRVGLLRIKNKKILNYPYLYLLTNNCDFIEKLRRKSNSGVQVNLSSKVIKESPVCVPTNIIHETFDKIAIKLYDKIFNIQKENENLIKMRDILLPKLMSGEIRVPLDNQ